MAREFSVNGSSKKGSNWNGGSKKTSTNTRFFSLYNNFEGEAYNSVLNLGAWGNYFTLGISPKTDDKNNESSGKVYDYSKEASFILNPTQMVLLNYGLQMIWKAYNEDEKIPSIMIQGNNLKLEVGYASKKKGNTNFEGVTNRFYVAIYMMEDSKFESVATNYSIFVFEGLKNKSRDNSLIINYNPYNGEIENYEVIQAQFITFMNCIKSITENGLFMTNHATYDRLSRDLATLKGESSYEGKSNESKFMSSFGKNTKRTGPVTSSDDEDDEEDEIESAPSRRASAKKKTTKTSKKKSSGLEEIERLTEEEDDDEE